jgi:plastocyanin
MDDIAARGIGPPGRGPFTGERLLIPRLDIDVPMQAVTVGADGVMPRPPSIDTAAWYDFSTYPGVGGVPGIGGNVIVAGDSGRQGVGIGPMYKIIRMVPGDYAMIRLTSGDTICYRAEFNKLASNDIFESAIQSTPSESLTMITAGTGPTDRRLVWGRRVDCATAPTPTPTALAGHHKLRMRIEGNAFVITEGQTVPPGRHTVDFTVILDEAGARHSIAFYDTEGRELINSGVFEGPTTASGAFGVGPPQPPGTYTFKCSVHPEMTGTIDVQS